MHHHRRHRRNGRGGGARERVEDLGVAQRGLGRGRRRVVLGGVVGVVQHDAHHAAHPAHRVLVLHDGAEQLAVRVLQCQLTMKEDRRLIRELN